MTPGEALVWVTGGLVFVTFLLVIVTSLSARAAFRTVDEMKAARLREAEPYVIFQVEHGREIQGISNARLRNIGRGPAFDVKCEFRPDFPYPAIPSRQMSELNLFKELRVLPHGDERSFFLGGTAELLRNGATTPTSFDVCISYKDSFGNPYTNIVTVDITETKGLAYVRATTLEDIKKEIDKLVKTLGRLETEWRHWLSKH